MVSTTQSGSLIMVIPPSIRAHSQANYTQNTRKFQNFKLELTGIREKHFVNRDFGIARFFQWEAGIRTPLPPHRYTCTWVFIKNMMRPNRPLKLASIVRRCFKLYESSLSVSALKITWLRNACILNRNQLHIHQGCIPLGQSYIRYTSMIFFKLPV